MNAAGDIAGKMTVKDVDKKDKTELQRTDQPEPGQLLIYRDGGLRLQVRVDGRTVWLTQRLIADLFQKDVRTINEHLRNIFDEEELDEDSVIRKFRITASDGKPYDIQHYNLDAILAVGYRVRSARGTLFRQWATARPTSDFDRLVEETKELEKLPARKRIVKRKKSGKR